MTVVNPSEFSQLGFAPGVVTGVRSFKVTKAGRLTGVFYPQEWTVGENQAQCLARPEPEFSYPGMWVPDFARKTVDPPWKPPVFEECRCGFYGYFDGSDDFHARGLVTGVVEGYGETIIGTRGFRAMKARIVALLIRPEAPSEAFDFRAYFHGDQAGLTPARADLVAHNYSEIPLFASFAAMLAEFPPDLGAIKLDDLDH